jgi:uncharacterized membrane protein (UPF0182 family)
MVQGSGIAAGAGHVDLYVRLPLRLLLTLLLLLTAVGLLVPLPKDWLRRGALIPLAATLLMVPVAEWLVAPLVQRFWVQPRELAVETPYLKRTIRATRRAFGLEGMRSLTLQPRQSLTAADLASAPGTLANIRLWDSTPLLAANRQLQQLRLYYTFPSAAVDRYPLRADAKGRGEATQVLIAAREMDSGALPAGSRTWLNRHLVFTHGHGFTVSPVNAFGSDGLPLFFVKDLGRSRRVRACHSWASAMPKPKRHYRWAVPSSITPLGRPRMPSPRQRCRNSTTPMANSTSTTIIPAPRASPWGTVGTAWRPPFICRRRGCC